MIIRLYALSLAAVGIRYLDHDLLIPKVREWGDAFAGDDERTTTRYQAPPYAMTRFPTFPATFNFAIPLSLLRCANRSLSKEIDVECRSGSPVQCGRFFCSYWPASCPNEIKRKWQDRTQQYGIWATTEAGTHYVGVEVDRDGGVATRLTDGQSSHLERRSVCRPLAGRIFIASSDSPNTTIQSNEGRPAAAVHRGAAIKVRGRVGNLPPRQDLFPVLRLYATDLNLLSLPILQIERRRPR